MYRLSALLSEDRQTDKQWQDEFHRMNLLTVEMNNNIRDRKVAALLEGAVTCLDWSQDGENQQDEGNRYVLRGNRL